MACELCEDVEANQSQLLKRWTLEEIHEQGMHEMTLEWRRYWAGDEGWARKRSLPKVDRKKKWYKGE